MEYPKTYEAKEVEETWRKIWQEKEPFKAHSSSHKPAYCIVIPPPNVTGRLHMGHALVNTLQDVLIRWKRMCGFETLWVPGTDHAGIATQTVVERHLLKTTGKKRVDFPREEFLSHTWKWKEQNESRILEQLRFMGCSCDWSRLRFTMDNGNNLAVRSVFKKMFDEGLIYRGDYLVNWDPVTQTALADDEVEYEERHSFLWYILYPIAGSSNSVTIATTRPETLLGDTAVAVSPKDERYRHLIGQAILHPLTGRKIPIIADPFVDPTFGTGALKVTPAHDPNDYKIGIAHHLPMINILTPDGKINENGGAFAGLTIEDAREAIVAALKQQGFLLKVEPHLNRVGVSYRSKATIQPYLSKQWFVKMERFKKELRDVVEEERCHLIPENWENTYFHWIDNLRDWCISRQLWWGHRIPIWYHRQDPSRMVCYAEEGVPPEVAADPDNWEQDPDVLDTWFSSALWPFATLGWPHSTGDFHKFYPNAVLITGHDILFFWVARMLMMGQYVTGQSPFPAVFLHGLIYGKSYWRDTQGGGIQYCSPEERMEFDKGKTLPKDVQFKWEKMSKSKGNVIDPLEIIDEYGTDAMRMALCSTPSQLREIDLDRRRFEEYRNFANKLWNGARFVLMNLEITPQELGLDESAFSLEDQWILSVMTRTVRQVNAALSTYGFDAAATLAYDFFWKEFCAYYVEIAKPVLFGKVGSDAQRRNKKTLLAILLCSSIRLLHPITPFITEELFKLLKERLGNLSEVTSPDRYTREMVEALQSPLASLAPYPQVLQARDENPAIEEAFALVDQAVYTLRNIRGEMKLPPGLATDLYLVAPAGHHGLEILKNYHPIISALVRIQTVHIGPEDPQLPFASKGHVQGITLWVPLPAEMIAQEKTRLQKERERLQQSLEKMRKQLENPEFISKAPPALIAKHRAAEQQTEQELTTITEQLQRL